MSALLEALLKAQVAFPPIKKNAKNPHFGNRYADLQSIVDTVRPVLADHGLAFYQAADAHGEFAVLRTVLFHAESGESLESTLPIVREDNPQKVGSLLTYMRRYGLCALLGIVTEDDDDGEGAAPKAGNGSGGFRKSKEPEPEGWDSTGDDEPPPHTDDDLDF